MDFHILIVISCVFLASLCSLLFINKFFRRKTFEEIIAEKKAMTEKIYGQTKAAAKKPKKLQQLKKEAKREKKQRQKEQAKDNTDEHDDSDAPSEQPSVEDDQPGLSKQHVEFEPEPEILTAPVAENARRSSNAEKENVSIGNSKQKSKKDKKNGKSGILVNKNEPIAVKENAAVEEQLNHFETKQPKDVVELKKLEKKDDQKSGKKEKNNKKDKQVATTAAVAEKLVAEKEPSVEVVVTKEIKQEEKVRQSSPKNQQQQNQNSNNNNNNSGNKSNNKPNKKQIKETAATKELMLALDKLNETDTVGVSLLMNLFRRAELNRSEIQILIDYLLNKQQDMPSSHSEWSDDICQKLKRQLEEKERALAEEQESSVGIQAKLRELRSEINTERAQMNATIKAYIDKLQSKDSDIVGLNQELQSLNEKITLERQQFQAKLLREKQAGSQDVMAQLQLMQNELAHKDKCIGDLTLIVNASRQAVEESAQQNNIIQSQAQQIRALEQQRDELEQISNNRIFELEKTKTLETENAESKVEIRNLQNAFESYKVDMTQARNELDSVRAELSHARNVELGERQTEIQTLQAKNAELTQQLAGNLSKSADLTKEQSGLQVTLDALKSQLNEKEHQLAEFNTNNAQLLQQLATAESNSQQQVAQHQVLHGLVDSLKADVATKHQQLQEVEQNAEQFSSREKELQQQLHEQKEKNNDLRMKNWKLVEALQNAETTIKQNKSNASLVQQQQLLAATQKSSAGANSDPAKDPKQIRELFQRLYPEAVKACASTALSASFEQWVEQVLATHIKQSISQANTAAAAASSSNKSTQSNSSSSQPPSHNSHNNNKIDKNLLNSESTNNNSNSRTNSSSISASSSNSTADTVEVQKLHTQNAQLRTKIDELTKLVTKTSNTLSELEGRAREQDEHWRSIVRSKDDQIYSLQHSNGEQDI